MAYSIGIDLTATAIRLVQIARRRGTLSVLGTCTKSIEPNGLPADADAIRALLTDIIHEAGFKRNTNTVVGLPHEKVFFNNFTTDLATREDVRRLLRFELEDDFPVPFDDLVVDICGHRRRAEGDHEYLVAATGRRELDPWIRALESSQWRGPVLSTDGRALEALARLTRRDEEDTICVPVHTDGHRMVLGVLQDDGLVCARHRACTGDADALAAVLAREIELTTRERLRNQRQAPVRILLSGPDVLVGELSEKLAQATGREVQQLRVASAIPASQVSELDGGFAIALGFALQGLAPADEQLNFLHADPTKMDRAAKSRTKRAAFVSVVLLVAILGLLGVKTLRDLNGLRTEQATLEREIRTIFVEAFPKEKKIVNELAQMTEHVDSLRKQRDTLVAAVGTRIRPLWALQVLSETLAMDSGIRISSFVVADTTIHIVGTADSFESVEQLLEGLRQEQQFDSVELEDVASSRGSERPEFRVLISVRTG